MRGKVASVRGKLIAVMQRVRRVDHVAEWAKGYHRCDSTLL